jgi:diadenosine tetraphosphate (Ap4A) HIT family hydrolase
LASDMFFVAKKVAADLGLTNAYQLHFNVWKEWWQEVMHIHMHLTSNK